MKRTIGLLAVAVLVLMAFTLPEKPEKAAAGGIKFGNLRLEKALKEAAASGKLVFIDVHTSWCGPCKEMARTTFQSEEVGKLFNKKFINLKIDAEKDPDGPDLQRTYAVSFYPTLLFIDGEGKLVKKLVGKQTEEKLLSIAKGL